jgi:hypothetical protein
MCLAPQRPDTLMLPPATATPRRPRPLTLAATLTIALTLGATEIATNTREQRTLPPSAQERTTSAVSGWTRRRHRNGAQTLNPSRFRKRRQRPLAANVQERVAPRERRPPSQDVAGSGRLNPRRTLPANGREGRTLSPSARERKTSAASRQPRPSQESPSGTYLHDDPV